LLELLKFLYAYFPKLDEFIGPIGAVAIIIGLLNAAFGYKLFKLRLAIIGFLAGAAVGFAIFMFMGDGTVGSDAMMSYIVVGGLIGSIIAETLHKVGVFFVIGSMGAITVFLTTQDARTSLVVGIICGVAGVFLEKYVVIVITALSGGTLAATGIWFVALSNEKNTSTQAIGWVIGMAGICFQLWLENKKPKKESETGKACHFAFIKDIKSKFEDVDADDAKAIAVKALLALPIVIGIILGSLFHSGLFGLGVIAVLYTLVMLQFIRKRKADISPNEFIQKFTWEQWINKVLDNNGFVFLVPLFPGFFVMSLIIKVVNNGWGDFLGFLAIAGVYSLFLRALPNRLPKKSPESSASLNNNPITPQSDTVVVAPSQRCPNCACVLTPNSLFCSECGSVVQATESVEKFLFCSECGKKLPSDSLFCYNCGTAQ
jgi:hypothetical protein